MHPFPNPANPQIDYPRELNPQQLAAVTAVPGPALVIAGAGAGKTRTLTYRVAWLIEQGIPPENILLLTFTNKAAREMMARVAELLPHDLAQLWGGTFHSLGYRILRQHAALLGYGTNLTILDRDDAKELLAACLAEPDLQPVKEHLPKPEVLGEILSLSANGQVPIGRVLTGSYDRFETLAEPIEQLASRYQTRKREGSLLDFDDLLVLCRRLLSEQPDIREHYQRRFHFVLVDEYQDTNQIQSDLVDLLAARHRNLMAVGDDSQSIYSWRGANFLNILEFPKRYPDAVIYRIETNYRSTPQILELANAAIASNLRQHPKRLAAVRPEGGKPGLVVCPDERVQAMFVARQALRLHEHGVRLDRMAVLYRSHFHALDLQLELQARHVPYLVTSGVRFFEQAHLKDVIAFLRLIGNPGDEPAFRRLVQMLPGVGARAGGRLWAAFAAGLPLESTATVEAPEVRRHRVGGRFEALRPLVPKKAAAAWAQLAATLEQLEDPVLAHRPGGMIRLVLEAMYRDYLHTTYETPRRRLDEIEQMADYADQYHSLPDLLAQLALVSNLDAEDEPGLGEDGDDRIHLSTVHQAKGLEFEVVFLIMLCDGYFPSARSVETAEGEEEERRLFYVAITRARDLLYLCHALTCAGTHQRPSRFLREIPSALVEEIDLVSYRLGR